VGSCCHSGELISEKSPQRDERSVRRGRFKVVFRNRKFCVEKDFSCAQLRSSTNVFVLFALNVWPTYFSLQNAIRALTKRFPAAIGKAPTSEVTSCFVKAITPPLYSLSLAGLRQATPGALTAKSNLSPLEGRIALPVPTNYNWG
jgi:hypothetical protein